VEIVTQNQDDLYSSQIRVNQEKSAGVDSGQMLYTVIRLTLRLLMSYIYIYIYIYGAPILDVSRSHTTTQHSR